MTWQRTTLDALFGALSALAVTMWLLSGWQVQLRPADREAHVIPASGQESSPVRALHGAHGVLDVAEDERDLAKVRVDPRLFEALVAGYLRGAGAALLAVERDELVFASQLMTLLLGMRFLADHLAGDRYFTVTRPAQNLHRAAVQFRLHASILRQQEPLEERLAHLFARTRPPCNCPRRGL